MTSELQKRHGYTLPERIDGHELVCATMMIPDDPVYKRAFFGAINSLGKWWSWEKTYATDDRRASDAAAYWRGLILEHYRIGDCGFEDNRNKCLDYPPQNPMLDYAPMDPFTQPGHIPDGYIGPPWRVVESGMLQIVGLQIGDVITGYDGLPVTTPALGQGLARFRVNVTGKGRAILTLLAIPFGGAVLITKDGDVNPLNAVWLELERDLVSVPPETVVEILQEVEFSTAGEHYIDVTFLPRFNDAITLIGYGGGLRKVTLCGLCPHGSPNCGKDQECVVLRQNPFDPCSLQQSTDNGVTWVEIFNSRQCAVDTVKDMNGSRGEIPDGANPDLHQCFDLDLTVQANGMRLIPLAVSSGWTLQFTEVTGAWNDGDIGHDWVCPNGHAFFFGQCSPLVESAVTTDPMNTQPHMRLILRLPDGTYAAPPLDGSIYIVPQGQPEGNTFLLANDEPLADNQGSVSLHLLACNEGAVGISYAHGSGPAYVTIGEEFTVTPEVNGSYGGFKWINLTFSTPVTLQWVSRPLEIRSQDAIRFIWQGTPETNYSCGQDNGQPFTDTACLAELNTHMGESHTASGLWVVDNGSGDFTFKVISVP